MNITEVIQNTFGKLSIIKFEEKVTTLNIQCTVNAVPSPSADDIKNLISSIPTKDTFRLLIKQGNDEFLSLDRNTNITDFITEVKEYFQYHEDEIITIILDIDKALNSSTISIYNFDEFDRFVGSLSSLDFLRILSKHNSDSGCLNFEYLKKGCPIIETPCFRFGYTFLKCSYTKKNHLIQSNCYFLNASEFPFTAEEFRITNSLKTENNIVSHFQILMSLFSIISIFDYTSITSDRLQYKLNGYRLFQGEIKIDKSLIQAAEYFTLFDWVYSSHGNIADKLGLTRNILSLHISKDNLHIDDTLIHSIKSAHQTYLKENVKSYLSLRSSILDDLSWISQKSGEVIRSFLQAYKQSSFTFISFFISIFLLRTLRTGEFTKVFTSEVTIIALSFILISLIYLIVSFINVKKEKTRLERKYENLKNRYKDLLIQQDIDRILNSDSEFKYEMGFIDSRLCSYTWFWVITILLLSIAVLGVSELIPYSLYHK